MSSKSILLATLLASSALGAGLLKREELGNIPSGYGSVCGTFATATNAELDVVAETLNGSTFPAEVSIEAGACKSLAAYKSAAAWACNDNTHDVSLQQKEAYYMFTTIHAFCMNPSEACGGSPSSTTPMSGQIFNQALNVNIVIGGLTGGAGDRPADWPVPGPVGACVSGSTNTRKSRRSGSLVDSATEYAFCGNFATAHDDDLSTAIIQMQDDAHSTTEVTVPAGACQSAICQDAASVFLCNDQSVPVTVNMTSAASMAYRTRAYCINDGACNGENSPVSGQMFSSELGINVVIGGMNGSFCESEGARPASWDAPGPVGKCVAR